MTKIPKAMANVLCQYFPRGLTAIDLETTGLSPLQDRIVEIAAIQLTPDGEVRQFTELINPQIPIPSFTQGIHGISDEMVKDKPTINTIMPWFNSFIGNTPLIAHNAQFDLGFIAYQYHQLKIKFPLSDVLDSCRFARSVLAPLKKENKIDNFKLGTLANHFSISLENAHRALDDAQCCLEVFGHTLNQIAETERKKMIEEKAFLFKFNAFEKIDDFSLPKSIHVFNQWKEELRGPEHAWQKVLYQFIADQKPLKILYRGGTTTPGEFRDILPNAILPLPQGVVLHAKCLISDKNKSFSLKKIRALQITV